MQETSSPTSGMSEGGMAAARRLGRIAQKIRDRLPDDEDGAWLAQCLQDYLDHAPTGHTIEAALGLRVSAGRAPWWQAERRATRDAAIRELADTFHGRTSVRPHSVAELIRSYESVNWRRDRLHRAPQSTDARRVILFKIFSVGINVPASVRQLIQIIDV